MRKRQEEAPRRYNIAMQGMPFDEQAEVNVLGHILTDGERVLPLVEQHINEHSFYIGAHRTIFAGMQELVSQSKELNLITLSNALPKKTLAEVGGMAYLAFMMDGLLRKPSDAHLTSLAHTIREMERKRQMIALLHEGIVQLGENEVKVDSLISDMEKTILEMLHGGPAKPKTPEEIAADTIAELLAVRERQRAGDTPGLSWGVAGLNTLTTGHRAGDYNIIGGRTGDGKTALMCQSAIENAFAGRKVILMSYEMKAKDMMRRLIAHRQKISFTKLMDPALLTKSEMAAVMQCAEEIAATGLLVDECGNMSIQQVEARMRLHVMRGSEINYFDYLQKMRVPRGMTRYDYFTEASDTICTLAKTTNTPHVVLSQLSRPSGMKGKFNPNARPTLSDFKESGQIENDAHNAVLIYRPKEKDGSDSGKDELLLAKQRNGGKGVVAVEYTGPTLTFHDRDEGDAY